MRAKIAFFGTPDFALPALRALHKKHDIIAIITQPDKPSGRGLELKASAVKSFAIQNSIQCYQPENLKPEQDLDQILNQADAIICIAYGKIIPKKYLNLSTAGIINIHPSLLPRWRGAAPLQWTIFSGDKTTGVYLMKLDQGLDTGDVFVCKNYTLKDSETLGSLHDTLAELGAELLLNSIEDIITGKLEAKAQSSTGVSYAEKWEKEDAKINWNDDAAISERRIRASNPIPGAFCYFDDKIIKIFSAKNVSGLGYNDLEPGVISALNKSEIIISCGNNSHLAIDEMQLAGKKRLCVSEILKGKTFKIGDKLCQS